MGKREGKLVVSPEFVNMSAEQYGAIRDLRYLSVQHDPQVNIATLSAL